MVDHPNLVFYHLASVEQLLCACCRPYCHNICYIKALASFHFDSITYFCSYFCIINPILTKPKKPKALHDYTQYCNLIARLHTVPQSTKTPWYSPIAWLHAVLQSDCTIARSPAIWLLLASQDRVNARPFDIQMDSVPDRTTLQCQSARHSDTHQPKIVLPSCARPCDTPVPECQTLRHSSARLFDTQLDSVTDIRHPQWQTSVTQTKPVTTRCHSNTIRDDAPSLTVTMSKARHSKWQSPLT